MPCAVQRATAADVPYSMSSGCATTQSTRWKDSSGRAGNVMSAILPELFPVSDGQASPPTVINPCPSTQDQDEKASLLCAVPTGAKRELPLVIAEMLGRVVVDLREGHVLGEERI